MHWVDWIVHGGVIPHEVDHFIRIVLGGFHVGGERASRALKQKNKNH